QTGVSAWVSSGHKGLMGPAGSGLVYLAESFKLRPFITGGTGGGSHIIDLSSPRRPIDYEVGTPALSAIMGLAAGISEIGKSFDGDIKRVDTLTSFVFDGLSDIQNVRVLGPLDLNTPRRLPLASIVVDDIPSNELAFLLENQYGIATRAGLHCAPLTHKYLGTYPDGALRLSWNVSNTIKDIERALTAIKEIAKNNG
ncbi:MAG: aminotransferase class V-fold PLP-dependent enzyme, partial [Coriobacteriia bacterium]|nr:aminotransferase class V-fold PLP-dependent enzyme [Coriobacteriia bacterium]